MGGGRAGGAKAATGKQAAQGAIAAACHPRELTRAERRKNETRRKLLDAAMRLFKARGYSPVTTADIASAADVGTGTFYLHFESKSEIFIALAKRCAGEIIRKWRDSLTPGLRPAQMVNALLRVSVEFWQQDRDRTRLILEGGPPFEARAYVDLGHDISTRLAEAANESKICVEAVATMIVGLSFQLGRVALAADPEEARRIIAGTYTLIEHAVS